MSITITGDNNYSGVFDELMYVLGGANNAGHNDIDTTIGDEVFVFGNLHIGGKFGSTVTDTTYDATGTLVTDGTTWNTTATDTSNDTMHFAFTLHAGSESTFNFLTDAAPQDYSLDTDGDANYQAQSDDSAWNTNYAEWQASLDATYGSGNVTYSDPTTIETNVTPNNPHPENNDPDQNITLNVTATVTGPDTLTADYGGAKISLGFAVGSDHIAVDGVTSENIFDQFFTVASTTHTSANGNTVNDTTISLDGGGWSVDLYGVDSTAYATEADRESFAWNNIIQHA